jgi:hypothetical protein
MPTNNDKFDQIKEILKVYSREYKNISEAQMRDNLKMAQHNLDKLKEQEEQNQEEIIKRTTELLAKNRLNSADDLAKYEQKLQQDLIRRKLEGEISILQDISKEESTSRDRQLELLKKEKEILNFKNKGQEKEAKIVEKQVKALKEKYRKEDEGRRKEEALKKKEQDKQDKKENLEDQGLSYEFLDQFKSIFEPLKEEIALGNAGKRSIDKALLNSIKSVGKAFTDGLNAINTTISDYAKYQTSINARLQGRTTFGSLTNMLDEVAFSPLLSAKDLYSNLSQLVGQGIVTNVEQRAFFQTIKDGIATTFDTTSESLNRMIRIQRTDSTAARLGMEGYLTRFLNVYVENTEYLQSTFDNVASSLLEASAVIGGLKGVGASLEFEYVVQKWLGTLTGIGLSDQTAQSIATALGQLGAGNVDVLSSDVGRLLTMSANTVGANIGEILNEGLDADTTNRLLAAMVGYLQSIADNGTNVTKAELAKVFGVSISDLVAVAKMDQAAIKTINDDLLSYTGMYTELRNQFNQLPSRMGISNILENLFSNLTYQTGMSIAGNPASYAMWKITDLIQGVTGGINIPFITALGSGVDLNTTAENLMKLGLVGVNMLGNIGNIVRGVGSIGGGDVLLDKLKINPGNAQVKTFGKGLNLNTGNFRTSGSGTSQTTYIGQENADAYYKSTINSEKAKNEAALQKEIQNQEENNPTSKILKYITETVDLVQVRDKIIALTTAATTNYSELVKINSSDGIITKALFAINDNLTTNVLPAIKTISFGNAVFDKTAVVPVFSSENTAITTSLTKVSTVSAASPVSEYLQKIDFIDGFKSIVENIAAINQKLPTSFGYGTSSAEGFTQGSRKA